MSYKANTQTPVLDVKKQSVVAKGFTLVELLIAIAVIGILASVVIVAYNGTLQQAQADALKSDLKNAASAIDAYKIAEKKYPSSINEVNQGSGIKPGEGNNLTYTADPSGSAFCVQVQGSGMTYFMTEKISLPTQGSCSGVTGVPSDGGGTTEPTPVENGGIVSTVAGSTSGFSDGTGAAARFFKPDGIAIDSSGNLIVADRDNERIRKVTKEGVVTTIAGSTAGYADGTGTAARFDSPAGLDIDGAGNIYVADYLNHRIRKITPSGVVTTIAGSVEGYADGTGTAARFKWPSGLAVTQAGTVYVADMGNHRIRKISTSGVVTTVAGSTQGSNDGVGTAARFYSPSGVALDSSQNLYVADTYNNRIRKISTSGVVTTVAGSTSGYLNGNGTAARFYRPGSLSVDQSGNIYVADTANSSIRKITSNGDVTKIAGQTLEGYQDGPIPGRFNYPNDVVVDPYGTLYVTDSSNHRIRKIQQY